MKNNGLFSTLFIEDLKADVQLDDTGQGRMATLTQTWKSRDNQDAATLWNTFLKQALSYLELVPPGNSKSASVYPLYDDYNYANCNAVLYLVEPGANIDDTSVGRFYPAKLIAELRKRNLNWGILTDGARWRLYSTKSSRPYEDYVELSLAEALADFDEAEYGLFERFFHKNSFIVEESEEDSESEQDLSLGVYKCRLDSDRDDSEAILEDWVKKPLLYQIDEILQYLCNGFIFDTPKSGEEYTEEERAEIFESAVKLLYRCLFLFYAESRRLLPSDPEKVDLYRQHSIQALSEEARKFKWGKRSDNDQYDLWKHLKGLVNAVNDGDPEYGIMGYNGGLFDDEEEQYLGVHQLRNDFLSRALYLLSFVEPLNNDPDEEYRTPYEDLEVHHLGELYENILEFTVQLADADRIRRRTKKGVELHLASQVKREAGDRLIRKGEVFFGESALERKQTGSYYTPESLVRFLNEKSITQPLREKFEANYRVRFDQFLQVALNGHELSTRSGGAQSAAALIERFVDEEVLTYKVCDPAMGSGHFLVNAANQMAGLVIALLEEVPYVEGMPVSVSSRPNDWRRRITRHCLYGVDINPLAVNLAKLSLWLNSFAVNHKLTFLDHHLRCGNSLIGIRTIEQLKTMPKRKKDGKKKPKYAGLFDFTDLSEDFADTARLFESITEIDEDDTDAQKEAFEGIQQKCQEILTPLADIYTAYLMDGEIDQDTYRDLFIHLSQGNTPDQLTRPAMKEVWEWVESCQSDHHFFHWVLEYPDVFGKNGSGGFSATIGNPPWDTIRPNSLEFFSEYNTEFRRYDKTRTDKVAKQILSNNPEVKEKWESYCSSINEQHSYFKEEETFKSQGKGEINTFKLFLEQFYSILKNNSHLGIIVPSGIYTDKGCQSLRELFLGSCRIEYLYCFENRKGIFNIHRMYKFVLLGISKGKNTNQFKCGFMIHNPELLYMIDFHALKISINQIKRFSPDTLSILEFDKQPQIEIVDKVYSDNTLLGDHSKADEWNIDFRREFHMTYDRDLFSNSPEGLPLFEGKNIWQFDTYFSRNKYFVEESVGRDRLLSRNQDVHETLDYQNFRVVYRKIAANTNERTLVSTIIPQNSFTAENLTTNKLNFTPNILLYTCGLLNSVIMDFVIRLRVSTAVNINHVQQLPLPRLNQNEFLFKCVCLRVARLVCCADDYDKLWAETIMRIPEQNEFWYSDESKFDYGPLHEQEIRRRLQNEAHNLTPEWGPHCGVHDRLPDRRDTGDRAQLRAEIDAYVAHLYGLSRDDFSYILDTFPVLKKKEEKAFGEFMSKRKCLEEYDRIEKVLNGGHA